MSGQTVCGFRDSAYLYYPLFEWIDAQWASGEIPLWNPYCNFGMPVVGDGTSSIFYPGKLIFFCRFLEFPARYGIYLAIHIPIAATGTYWFARTLKANPTGATLAAFAFAFGGSVIFQVCNAIYLVSAAWLPFALCCVWKMVKSGQYRWAIAAAVCCTLMILGGDPQMVYHVGLIALVTILGEIWRRCRRWKRTRNSISNPTSYALSASGQLCLMVLATCLLSAVQLIPTYSWSKRSERTNPAVPVNIYYAEASDSSDIRQALLGPPDGTIDHAYQFSQPPWSMLELVWPNFSGKPFPKYQRWTNLLPGADRVWTPSIYMGLLVALFGLSGIRFSGRRRKNVWLSWLFLWFAVGSFGWYGAAWLLTEFGGQPPKWIGPQAGGLYWLMQILLPKYYAFRYPAKLFLLASLALAMLAGINLRRIRIKSLLVITAFFIIISGGTGLALLNYLNSDGFENAASGLLFDQMFGPFDSAGAIWQAKVSAIHCLAVLALAIFCFVRVTGTTRPTTLQQGSRIRDLRRVHFLLVILTALEILIANRWLTAEIPSQVFTAKVNSPTIKQLSKLKSSIDDQSPARIFRSRRREMMPPHWPTHQSDDRLGEIVNWQRESLYPKYHLNSKVVVLGSFASVWPSYYEQYLSALESTPSASPLGGPPRIHGAYSSQDRQSHTLTANRLLDNTDSAKPLVWLALPPSTHPPKNPANVKATVQVTQFTSNRVTAIVSTETPRELAFGRIAEPGWKVTTRKLVTETTSEPALANQTIQRVLELDRRMETLVLPMEAGKYQIEFWYSPLNFWIGAWLSGISWLVLVGGSAYFFTGRMYHHNSEFVSNDQALPTSDQDIKTGS